MGKLLHRKTQSKQTDDGGAEEEGIDGGWAWVVCAGAFLVNFILDGTMCSFGVLLLELLDHFGEGKAKSAWVGSSLIGMSLIIGPGVSLLLSKFSCRQITIVGALISTAGFGLSVLSPNIAVMILTYGILGGIGFSMSYIASIIAVSEYFRQKRALATCIAMSGSGFGTFSYPYLMDFVLARADWKTTVLILSGIVFLCIFCGAVYRPVLAKEVEDANEPHTEVCEKGNLEKFKVLEEEELLEKRNLVNKHIDFIKNIESPCRLARSTDLVPRDKVNDGAGAAKNFFSYVDLRDRQRPISLVHTHTSHHSSSPMLRKDIFYSGSVPKLPGLRYDDSDSFTSGSRSDVSSVTSSELDSSCSCIHAPRPKLFNFALFKDKVFILLLLVCFLWTVQAVPLMYVPDLAVSRGVARPQAAILISAIGITNIVGRLLSGIITHLIHVRSSTIYTCALLVAAIINFLLPWFDSFSVLAVCCGIYGLCMGIVVSLRTIVLADHLGIEKLTESFGMVALFQGIGFMTNAPLAGVLFDAFGSYLYPFTMAGTMYLLSAILCFSIPCLERCNPAVTLKDIDVIEIKISGSSNSSESTDLSSSTENLEDS